jgi:cytochrome c oxidase subunit 3
MVRVTMPASRMPEPVLAAEMGKIVPYRSPRTSAEEGASKIGMVVFLGSWAMMFATLFFTYGGLRARATHWPPEGVPTLPIVLPLINTLVIALSSAAFQAGVVSTRAGQVRRLGPLLLATFVLGAAFIGLQGVVWNDLFQQGLKPGSGPYGSVFYGLTWIHAAHVVIGLLAVGWLSVRAFLGAYGPAQYLPVKLWAMYWHFVGVVWAVILVSVYLV